MLRHPLSLLLVALPFAAVAWPERAASEPILAVGGDRVSLDADRLEVDVFAGEAVLTGNVTLAKGDLAVRCPRIDVRFNNAPTITWVRGSGGVSADVRGVHAEAPTAELDMARQVLDLRGGVKLTRAQGWITAESARIDVATGKVSATQVKGSIPVPAHAGKGP